MSASDHFDFGYVIEDRKIRNACFLFFPVFIFWGVKTAFKVRVKNHFCGKNGLFENLVSQSYFAFKDTKFVIDTIPLSLIVLEIFHKNDFSTLTLNTVFTPPPPPQIWKRGKNKKTRISYFSVLYNIFKNRNDRRRTPKILSLWDLIES